MGNNTSLNSLKQRVKENIEKDKESEKENYNPCIDIPKKSSSIRITLQNIEDSEEPKNKLVLVPLPDEYSKEEIFQPNCALAHLPEEIIKLIFGNTPYNNLLQLLATCRYFFQSYSKMRGFDGVAGFWRPVVGRETGSRILENKGHLLRYYRGVIERWKLSTKCGNYNIVEDYKASSLQFKQNGSLFLLESKEKHFPETFILKKTEDGWTICGYSKITYERLRTMYNV